MRWLLLILIVPVTVLAVPPTPTNAPRAHPLAPSPHTSVGVFWIYTDASTGRQWTGGTYKVKRCSGASCTPTTVVATGRTTADYQDTGLSANTVYGYRYLANDGSDSGDSPTVYVTTLAADSTSVQFPDATWTELLSPLVEEAQIPFAWYNSTATTNGQSLIAKFPVAGVGPLTGTGSITNNTTTITGTGTFFLEQVSASNPACLRRILINGVDAGAVSSVNSNTSITLVTTWTGGTQSNVSLNTNYDNTGSCGGSDPLGDYLTGNQLMYYDSPQALWQVYFRTGDPQYMRGAIQGSEAIFAGLMWLGRNRAWNGFSTTANTDNMPPARSFQFGGYVLLGLAGHSGVWDLLDNYLTNRYPVYISNFRPTNGNQMYNREQAYTIQYASWFVAAAPDSFPRSNGTTTSLNGGTTVDGDLTDGRKDYWRDQLDIDIPGVLAAAQSPEGNYRTQGLSDSYAEGDYPYPPGEAQPFMSGLLYDALGYAWRNTDLASATRDSARKQVLKAAANMYLEAYNTNIAADNTSVRWRSMFYFLDGGTRLNPYAFRYEGDSAILNNTPDSNMITQARQLAPQMIATFGWAYAMSGKTIYKTAGDEIANAAFAAVGENTGGTGDGIKSLCDSTGNYKNYGECYRSSAKYFAERLTSPSSLGTSPVVTMPGNMTLTGGVNQASLTAVVVCTNTPCTYRWSLTEWPRVDRLTATPMFYPDDALSTKLSGLEAGTYKLVFYALDNLGLVDYGNVTITVGDGVFPPVVKIHKDGGGAPCTTSSSMTGVTVRAYSAAGRTLTHVFSGTGPKDQSAPTITPSGTTGNVITVTVSGLSAGWWVLKDVVTDSAGTSRTAYFIISNSATCAPFAQPSNAHNTIPLIAKQPHHVLSAGSTSTRLYVVPIDPEGWTRFASPATGYTYGANGNWTMPTALTHSWTQTAGPVSATIINGTTLRPDITGMTTPGTYTFQYSGTDQQNDVVTALINVTTSADEGGDVTTSSVRLYIQVLSIVLMFSFGGYFWMLQKRRIRKQYLSPPRDRYYSVIGPDRRKKLHEGSINTFEREAQIREKVRRKDGN